MHFLFLSVIVMFLFSSPIAAMMHGDDDGGGGGADHHGGAEHHGGADNDGGADHHGMMPVIKSGKCTASSTYKLTVVENNASHAVVKMEVDQNKSGVTWNVKFYRNNNLFAKGDYTTAASGGNFVAKKTNNDDSGTFKVVATRSGESCTASATL